MAVLVPTPAVYLKPVVFSSVVVVAPAGDDLVWQGTDTFEKSDEWVETMFPVNEKGRSLVLHVDGRLQVDFAEVVFENGDAQVVDFDNKTLKNQTCRLLDFKDGRKVSHVRMVARVKSDTARATVRMAK